MRTITVPKKYGYPTLDITVNGKEYTVKSGEEIEVEDHIAEAIENAVALAPKVGRNKSIFALFIEGSLSVVTESDLEGIESISPYVFYNNDIITSIGIPSGTKSISEGVFSYCNKLNQVSIPASVTNIGAKAFSNCVNLKRVTIKAVTPPSIVSDTFVSVSATCTYEVPAESLEAYKSAPNWSALASQIVAIKE